MASQSIPRANISVKIKHGIQVIVFEKTNTAFVEFAEFKRSILKRCGNLAGRGSGFSLEIRRVFILKGNTVHVENYI